MDSVNNEKVFDKTKHEGTNKSSVKEGIGCLMDLSTKKTFKKYENIAADHPEIDISHLYSPDISISVQDTPLELSHATEKSQNCTVTKWKRHISKYLRNSGEAYETHSKEKKVRKNREMRAPCGEKCKLKCSTKINEEERRNIFSSYWSLANIEKQREFINNSMRLVEPKYRYPRVGDGTRSPRQNNNAYYFTRNGEKIRVCKIFFENTLDINDRTIRTVQEKRKKGSDASLEPDLRGKHGKQKTLDPAITEGIRRYIDSIPKIENHYTKENSSKKFVDGSRTLADFHRDYVSECKENNVPYGSYAIFRRIFMNDFNISFFISEKDLCEICVDKKDPI